MQAEKRLVADQNSLEGLKTLLRYNFNLKISTRGIEFSTKNSGEISLIIQRLSSKEIRIDRFQGEIEFGEHNQGQNFPIKFPENSERIFGIAQSS